MACSSTCPTQDHASLGECLRAKGIKVAYCNSAGGSDYTLQKKWDAGIEAYRSARREGIQPQSSRMSDVRAAVAASDAAGKPFNAGETM